MIRVRRDSSAPSPINGSAWIGSIFSRSIARCIRASTTARRSRPRTRCMRRSSYLLRHNASLRDLLKSDYVVINRVLAHYYGIAGVQGDGFEKVAVPQGLAARRIARHGRHPLHGRQWRAHQPGRTRRVGAAQTAPRSAAARSRECPGDHAPRGQGAHDPRAFAGAPGRSAMRELPSQDRSHRLRLGELRRRRANGAPRTATRPTDARGKPDPKTKKTWTIEAAAQLHNGPAFKDYFGLRDIVASKSDAFARGFSEALIEYALGRPLGFSDETLVADMLRQAGKKDLAMREFIHALVRSKEFHTK